MGGPAVIENPATTPWQVPVAFCKSEPSVLGLQHANTSSEVKKIYMNLHSQVLCMHPLQPFAA